MSANRRPITFLTLLLLCLCAAPCTRAAGSPHPIVGTWVLESVDGVPAMAEFSEFRLVIKDTGFLIKVVKAVNNTNRIEEVLAYEIHGQDLVLRTYWPPTRWNMDGNCLVLNGNGFIYGKACRFSRMKPGACRADTKNIRALVRRLPACSAIMELADLGPKAREAVPALVDTVWKKDMRFQADLGLDLALRAIDVHYAISILTNALLAAEPRFYNDEDYSRKMNSAIMLGQMRSEPDRVVPALIAATRMGNHYSVDALAKFGPRANAALPLLLESAGVDELLAIAEIGSSAECNPKPKLVSVMAENREYQDCAAYALCRIGQPDADTIQALARALGSENQIARIAAAMVLRSYGPPAREAVVGLRTLLADPVFEVRLAAGLALNAICPRKSKPGTARVQGRCLHVTLGRPGALAGHPGDRIPDQPAPGTEVFFLGQDGLVAVTAQQDGVYDTVLPPGRYEIAWQEPPCDADFFSFRGQRMFSVPGEMVLVVVLRDGQVLEKNIVVSIMCVD